MIKTIKILILIRQNMVEAGKYREKFNWTRDFFGPPNEASKLCFDKSDFDATNNSHFQNHCLRLFAIISEALTLRPYSATR